MAGRALVFSNPETIRLLKERFVPYAGDQWYLHRQQDAAGQFFWKVAQQGLNKDRPLDTTRQGIYAAAPDGTLLGSINSWSPERTVAMLRSALDQWQRLPKNGTPALASTPVDEQYHREPPPGGLILDVFSRIPLAPAAGETWSSNQATGRDHMWLTREEWHSLLPRQWRAGERYPVPQTLAERLIRFHLVDNIRGEPPLWTRDEIRQADLTLTVEDAVAPDGKGAPTRLRLQGTARLQSAGRWEGTGRGYDARLQGLLTYDHAGEHFSRFDLLSWGEAWGEGRYTGGAPKGHFPLVIAFSLAGDKPADRIPPQGSRNLSDYFGIAQAAR